MALFLLKFVRDWVIGVALVVSRLLRTAARWFAATRALLAHEKTVLQTAAYSLCILLLAVSV